MNRDIAPALFRVSLALAFLVLALPIPFITTRPQEVLLMTLGLIGLAIVSAPVFVWKDFRLWEPLTLVILMVFVCVSFKLLYVVAFVHQRPYVNERLLLGHPPQVLTFGTVVIIVGLVSFMVGYWRRQHRWRLDFLFLPRYSNWNPRSVVLVSFCLISVSALAFGLFIRSTDASFQSFEDLSQKRFIDEESVGGSQRIFAANYIFYRIAAFAKFPFYLTLAWFVQNRRPLLSVEAFLIAASGAQSVALAFFMSSRASIALLLLDAVIITYFLQKRVDLRKVLLLSGGVLVLLLTQIAVRNRNSRDFLEYIEFTVFGRDLMDVSKTAHIVNAVSYEIEYRYGETLIGWLAAPIPSSVWPDKPMWSESFNFLIVYVYGDDAGFTGIPPGLVAELYWNLGWVGVCAGMLAMGWILRVLYDAFLPFQNNPNAVLIYTLICTRLTLFTLGSDFGTGVIKTVLDVIPMCGLMWVVHKAEP